MRSSYLEIYNEEVRAWVGMVNGNNVGRVCLCVCKVSQMHSAVAEWVDVELERLCAPGAGRARVTLVATQSQGAGTRSGDGGA